MPTPFRKESGHRIYESEQVKQLHFIKRARELGFSLNDIRELIGANNETPSCDEVFLLTQTHLSNIREKIVDLKKLENRIIKHFVGYAVDGFRLKAIRATRQSQHLGYD